MGVGALALCLGIGDDHFDAWQQFARFEQANAVRTALFHDGHSIVAQRSLVNIHGRGIGVRGALKTHSEIGSTAERGADRAGRQAQALEELGEGGCELNARALFGNDCTSSDTGQVDAT